MFPPLVYTTHSSTIVWLKRQKKINLKKIQTWNSFWQLLAPAQANESIMVMRALCNKRSKKIDMKRRKIDGEVTMTKHEVRNCPAIYSQMNHVTSKLLDFIFIYFILLNTATLKRQSIVLCWFFTHSIAGVKSFHGRCRFRQIPIRSKQVLPILIIDKDETASVCWLRQEWCEWLT